MNTQGNLKGVIFDLWNTLIYLPKGKTLREKTAMYIGIDVDVVKEYTRMTISRHTKLSFLEFCRLLYEVNNKTYSENDLENLRRIYAETIEEVRWIEGARELLNELKRRGYKTAIVSNSTEFSLQVIKRLKINNLVDTITISCLTGIIKPDPRAFRSVLDEWRFDEKEVIVVGDKIITDILGAKVANLNAILYSMDSTYSGLTPNISVHGVINSLPEVLNIIKCYNTTSKEILI